MDKHIIGDKLKLFQELINYQFQNPEILLEALTTPQYGNENNLGHYEILETLGDAVIKLIFSLKIYNSGENDPGRLTKTKQCLENNQTFFKVATEIELWKYISKLSFVFIEIFADDVKCSHGCTIGQLDDKALFYLRSRGIPEKEANALLMYAFSNNVLNSVKITELKKRINKLIANKLGVNIGFNL